MDLFPAYLIPYHKDNKSHINRNFTQKANVLQNIINVNKSLRTADYVKPFQGHNVPPIFSTETLIG